ncbi:MFS transporter [Legionella jordanis]|uniref:Multidrug resistance protein, MFS family n=1 Tax=Legionella jordanis TaxID=456 RepID=A0A0W0VCS6_9GAMM|nr:MFS transporter [Legionella jordanis]KTD17918.1 multidrug resistance protein, MFS family [Legionella jordanis]RMX02384.1 MFS transporter [Legionella jordanis]RMX21774.1 MFS transporter [Legionella jordanis]VEH13991.1 multidrug resistance protein, MFS family [Legionella jordanis]
MRKGILSWYRKYLAIPRCSLLLLPIIVVSSLITASCMCIALYLTKVKHFSILDIGETVSIYYTGCFIGSFIGGALTTKYSSINLSCISSLLLGIIFISLLTVDDLLNIKICMLFVGILVYVLTISNLKNFLKPANDKNTKLKLISVELIVFNISYSVSTSVLLVLSIHQIKLVLIAMGLSLIAIGGLTFKILASNSLFIVNKHHEKKPMFILANYKILLMTLANVALIGLIFSSIKVIYTPTIQQRFGGSGVAVIIASINPWLIFLIQPIVIEKVKNINNTLMMGLGGLGVGVGYCFFGFSAVFLTSAMGLIIMTIGEILFSPLSKSLIISQFNSNSDGLALGIWRSVFMGSGFVGPVMSGYLAEQYGNMVVWKLCGILGLICFLLSISIHRGERLAQALSPKNAF